MLLPKRLYSGHVLAAYKDVITCCDEKKKKKKKKKTSIVGEKEMKTVPRCNIDANFDAERHYTISLEGCYCCVSSHPPRMHPYTPGPITILSSNQTPPPTQVSSHSEPQISSCYLLKKRSLNLVSKFCYLTIRH